MTLIAHDTRPASSIARACSSRALGDRAFSLVELLIVIAIIGLLLGVLLPSLAGARESARGAVCSSNLRQLSVALESYANDFKDRFAPGAADALANLSRWHGSRTAASAAFSPSGGSLTAYLTPDGDVAFVASAAIRSCPTFAPTARRLAEARVGFERSAGGYGYNNAFVGVERAPAGTDPVSGRTVYRTVTDRAGASRANLQAPASTLAFADSALADGNPLTRVIEYSFVEPRFWPELPSSRPDPSLHFRHGSGQAVVAWLDGHVSSERLSFSAFSGVYPENPRDHRIGWFGSRDTNEAFGDGVSTRTTPP